MPGGGIVFVGLLSKRIGAFIFDFCYCQVCLNIAFALDLIDAGYWMILVFTSYFCYEQR